MSRFRDTPTGPETGFHFKICEPRVSREFDFRDDLRYHLSRISTLVSVEYCYLERENNVYMAKVRTKPKEYGSVNHSSHHPAPRRFD